MNKRWNYRLMHSHPNYNVLAEPNPAEMYEYISSAAGKLETLCLEAEEKMIFAHLRMDALMNLKRNIEAEIKRRELEYDSLSNHPDGKDEK